MQEKYVLKFNKNRSVFFLIQCNASTWKLLNFKPIEPKTKGDKQMCEYIMYLCLGVSLTDKIYKKSYVVEEVNGGIIIFGV
jgi:hypothetical protein